MAIRSHTFSSILVLFLLFVSWLLTWSESSWQVIWPSCVALLTVVFTRRALLGLFLGAASGAILLSEGNVWSAYLSLFQDHLAPSFSSSWKMGAVAFTLLLGGLASVFEKGGGMERIVSMFLKKSGNRSKALQGGVLGLGFVCFFDGLANSMLVGRVGKTLIRPCGVSREKLAYLVDSTSSSVACLAFVSTWIAYQLSMIRDGFAAIGEDVNPYVYFIHSVPYNFYCWFTLALCLIVVLKGFHPGPMAAAEHRALKEAEDTPLEEENQKVSLLSIAIPLLTLLLGIVFTFYYIGLKEHLGVDGVDGYLPITGDKVAKAFGTSQGPYIMALVGVVASVAAFVFYPYKAQRSNPWTAYIEGMTAMFMPLLILVGAWMLGSTLSALNTGQWIASFLGDAVPLTLLPMLIFIVGALISFSTGSSWGTMGILMPLAIPMIAGHPGIENMEQTQWLYSAAVGAVFSGAVFGDHCSPISDTTVVSSIACGVEPQEHVRTQLPYAWIAASLSIFVGFLFSCMLGVSPWLCLIIGFIFLYFIGRLHVRTTNGVKP